MVDRQLDEEKIFHVARGIEAKELREDYLAQICTGDQALRERVEALLGAYEQDQSLLQSCDDLNPTIADSVTESVGEKVGRYKLLQKIGEGGFGVVYLAEQTLPVRRKVALKVIKPGMDTHAVVARFEAERQALALMDHANIAKVFDGGATASGRPYFVMELVKGLPISTFCDENKFTIRERLNLFTDVCRAIQHAHQKGVIHRDIKPSNVLVTLHDGKPVAKVIDFGISKAISQQLTEKTLFTAHGQMIGTPQYMSPEQAEMSGLDIDTRSDVYSLGILLYELLTGLTPLDPCKIRGTAYRELQRMIREDEPVHPSRRCSTQGEQSATIAAQRKTDPRRLGLALRGELDWIVMKTLEKDRNRRYESASALARDVESFLNDETVAACPPSLTYRFQKFARRNRTLLLTGGTIATLLLASTLVSWAMYVRAENAATAAREATVIAKVDRDIANQALRDSSDLRRQQMIEFSFAMAASNRLSEAETKIADSDIRDEDKTELAQILQAIRLSMEGNPAAAVRILEALNPADDDVMVHAMLANAYFEAGDYWGYYYLPVVQGQLVPRTSYEHLFVGKAMFWPDYRQSIDYLDEAVALTSSPLSLTYRARSLALLASCLRADEEKTQEVEDLIDRAIEDTVTATRLFEARRTGSEEVVIGPVVQGTHLLVLIHAHEIYRQLSVHHERALREQEAEEASVKAGVVMNSAGELFDSLSRQDVGGLQYTRAWMGFYLKHKAAQLAREGQATEAEQIQKRASRVLDTTFFQYWLAVADAVRKDRLEDGSIGSVRQSMFKQSPERSE
ncbi:MAG: serine/threonine protein kinase, partial [Rubripirellula sp.]